MDDSERMSDAAVRVCVEAARDLCDLRKRQCERSPDMDVSAQAVVYDRLVRFGEEVLALRADILRAERQLAEARAVLRGAIEAEREACIKLCDGIAARWETERAAGCSDVARAAAGGTAAGALLCADAIRARGGGA